METDDFLRDSFFNKSVKTTLERCWAPPFGICSSKPINAHSIQNKRVLASLSLNGFVIMPQEKFLDKGETLNVDFREIGRDKASTFTGLCRTHDTEIFSPIDNFDVDLGNAQQLFLIAYRTIFYRFHRMVLDTKRLMKVHEDQVKVGRAANNSKDIGSKWIFDKSIKTWMAYKYKTIYDDAYLAHQYDIVKHDSLVVAWNK